MKSGEAKPDYSKEGVVIELMSTRVDFKTDGTSTRHQISRVKVQSEAGVQEYGLLSFPYQSAVEHLEIEYVRVRKPDGTVVTTPPDFVQDMPSEVSRTAPLYSDLKEKQVAVKRLSPGDILEYAASWVSDKPLAPGNFWISWSFVKSAVALDDELEISYPKDREVKIKSRTVQPSTRDDGDRRIVTWKSSHLDSQSKTEEKLDQVYEAAQGVLAPPDVLLSSFRSWDEVGRWYGGLQSDRVQPSPEVTAKAAELTKGLTDRDAKVKAIYNYVSLHYRYIGIDFGIGRYQPHSAADILDNQYGDCKDKHTLLAALLDAAGLKAYPALINSSHVVEVSVPSPGQFDHVITVVPKGSQLSWMDSTSEVAPLGFLLSRLRDKPALVVMPDKASFETTPAKPPFENKDDFTLNAKLDADGTLSSHVHSSERGDWEVVLRYAFRRMPQSQWKDLVERISYGARLGGTIASPQVGPLEDTDQAFEMTYDYTIKDYSDGAKRRFIVPLPPPSLREPTEEDLNRRKPFWVGAEGEWREEARIELPKGLTVQAPEAINLKNSYGQFESHSEVKDGVLVTKRHVVLKARQIAPEDLASFKKFEKSISDYNSTYIFLAPTEANVMGAGPRAAPKGDVFGPGVMRLPDSSNPEANNAEKDAREAMQGQDRNSSLAAFKNAITIDPKFVRAWIELGTLYAITQQKNLAVETFEKAVEANPSEVVLYKTLAMAYTGVRNRERAIATWLKLQTIAPDDPAIPSALGGLYYAEKSYKDAASQYELAVKANPKGAYPHFYLGRVLLHTDQKETGVEEFHKALEIDSSAEMLNNVAYEMAEEGSHLTQSLEFSRKAIDLLEKESRAVDIGKVQPENLRLTISIGAYWDTLGWIYFRLGDLAKAEEYLTPAWQISEDGTIADHLGQLFESEKKLSEARHMYDLALEVNSSLDETAERRRNLANVEVRTKGMSAGEELSRMRSVKLPTIVKGTANADFYVVLESGGKVRESFFINGSDMLRHADKELAKASFGVPFPASSSAYILRKGILSCSHYTGCTFVFYPVRLAAGLN